MTAATGTTTDITAGTTTTGTTTTGTTASRDADVVRERALVERARQGERAAFEELYQRLAPAAWRLALAVTREPALAAGAVASAFASTLATGHSASSNAPIRGQVLAAVRLHAADPAVAGVAVGVVPAAEPTSLASAYAALPERWRSALWILDAERINPQEAAVVLGVPAAAVAPLAMRARAGLGEHVIAVEASHAESVECRRTAERLVDYADNRLGTRDAGRVRRHLDGCDRCQGLLAELDDLAPSLRLLALPVPMALAASTEARWRSALVQPAGPLRLTLPSGRPVPAWAERTVAGAAAAIIALGISSAILTAGRNGRVRDDGLARSTTSEAPLGAGDGENALGGGIGGDGLASLDPLIDGGRAAQSASQASGDAVGPAVSPLAPSPSAPAAGLPSTGSPTPTPPSTGQPGPSEEPPAAEGDPAAQVSIGLGGAIGVAIGEECTGLDLGGTIVGCDPEITDAPLEVRTGAPVLPSLGL